MEELSAKLSIFLLLERERRERERGKVSPPGSVMQGTEIAKTALAGSVAGLFQTYAGQPFDTVTRVVVQQLPLGDLDSCCCCY